MSVVVVKVSGTPVDEPASCAALWDALADASRETRLVVVHGGGVAVDRRLAALGLESERRAGKALATVEQLSDQFRGEERSEAPAPAAPQPVAPPKRKRVLEHRVFLASLLFAALCLFAGLRTPRAETAEARA